MNRLKEFSLFIAWIVALVATLGSLYFGEILKWEPCSLCWYQRICLFPLVIILGIATYRRDYKISVYCIPQVIIGLIFAIYQYLYPHLAPYIGPVKLCTLNTDCSYVYFEFLGFITLPFLSIVNFVIILWFLILAFKNKNNLI